MKKIVCMLMLISMTLSQCAPAAKQTEPKEKSTQVASANPEQVSTPEKKDDEDNSEKRVLLVFSQMLTNFICILKDPKNPVNVGANLTALFAGIVNIGLEMFRHGPSAQDDQWGMLDEQDQELIEKIKEQLILAVQDLKLRAPACDTQEIL